MKEEEQSLSYVRVRPLGDTIDISFAFPPRQQLDDQSQSAKRSRFRNFKRSSTEPLSKTLKKIADNLGAGDKSDKSAKQRKNDDDNGDDGVNVDSSSPNPPQTTPHVALWSGDSLLTSDVALNSDGWMSGGRLQVDGHFYHVLFDPPTIKSLKVNRQRVLVGCPYTPIVELTQRSACPVEACRVEWFRSTDALEHTLQHASDKEKKRLKIEKVVGGWEKVGDGYHYVPTDDDVGRMLKVKCYPVVEDRGSTRIDEDHYFELASEVAVSRLPLADGESYPFEKRQRWTPTRCDVADDEFRVVSYNLLADYYTDSDFSRKNLFPYCPLDWLDGEYRRQILLREIPGYRSDVVMLQEVDRKMFRNGLKSVLGGEGMAGSLALKKEVPEGIATFWRTSRFKLLDSMEREFNDVLTNDAGLKDVFDVVDNCAPLKEKIHGLKSVYLINVLEDVSRPERVLVVANTHLFYQPQAAHIRLIQMEILLRQLRLVVKAQEEDGKTVSVILGGDFNSEPKRGLYEYLTTKSVAKTFNDWYSGGMAEYPGMDLSHDFSLFSASGTPSYTNFVAGFCGTLDYIYADASTIELKRDIPLSDHADVVKEIALPNRIFPSDHMPLVVDLKWKSS